MLRLRVRRDSMRGTADGWAGPSALETACAEYFFFGERSFESLGLDVCCELDIVFDEFVVVVVVVSLWP